MINTIKSLPNHQDIVVSSAISINPTFNRLTVKKLPCITDNEAFDFVTCCYYRSVLFLNFNLTLKLILFVQTSEFVQIVKLFHELDIDLEELESAIEFVLKTFEDIVRTFSDETNEQCHIFI